MTVRPRRLGSDNASSSRPSAASMGLSEAETLMAGKTCGAGRARHIRGWACALFRFDVFEPDAKSCAQAVPCLLDAVQEARVVLETVFEPVLFGLEADQHARRLAVTRDDDLLRLGFSKKPR